MFGNITKIQCHFSVQFRGKFDYKMGNNVSTHIKLNFISKVPHRDIEFVLITRLESISIKFNILKQHNI